MKRFFLIILIILAALIILPPLYYTIFPVTPPDLPAHGKQVEIRPNVSVNYTEEGDGPPVILVHGLPGTAYDWRETSKLLAERGYRAIAYDRVGYGRSNVRDSNHFTVPANTDDLHDLIKALDLQQKVIVVGWSYGGVIAMLAAMQYPEQLREIILVGTGGPSSDDDKRPEAPFMMKVLYSEPVLRWRAAVPPIGRGLMEVLSAQAFSDGPQPDWWMEGLRANFSRWDTVITYRSEIFNVGGEQEEDDASIFGQITVPTTIIHAEDDRLAPISIGRYLSKKIPNAKYQEIPAASHMLPVTHPELIADAVASVADTTATITDGQTRTQEDGSWQAWDTVGQQWLSPEDFWLAYAERRGGLTWGRGTEYPSYEEVSELDTFMVELESGVCLMEFFHSRWRRAQDVRRWDEAFNAYGGCPDVFK